MSTMIEPKYYGKVEKQTKEGYKKAIIECCDDLKNRLDDILCDFDKSIKEIDITFKIEYGSVSVMSITKEVCVEVEKEF